MYVFKSIFYILEKIILYTIYLKVLYLAWLSGLSVILKNYIYYD